MRALITVKDLSIPEKLGGIGAYYLSLRKHLPGNVEYFHYKSDMGQNPIVLFFKACVDLFRFAKKCKNKKQHIDLIHLNPSLNWAGLLRDGLMLLIARNYGKKAIVFFRGWHETMERKINKNRIVRKLFRRTFTKANAIIVLSESFRVKLRTWGADQSIYIETTTVDNELLKAVDIHNKTEKPGLLRLLFLSRVEKAKGVFELLKAYQRLKGKYSNLGLTVAGTGSQLHAAKEFVKSEKLRDVVFTGHLTGKHKAEAFSASDIFVFPTFHGEGMPNAVLEAMAFGLPVITRPVGGLVDFFETGRMGYLTESKDPLALARLIENLLENETLRKQMSEYNAAYARNHFLSNKVAYRLLKIYDDVTKDATYDATWSS
jgi:glycosyltransferase involved in cell wall biosynthesis